MRGDLGSDWGKAKKEIAKFRKIVARKRRYAAALYILELKIAIRGNIAKSEAKTE